MEKKNYLGMETKLEETTIVLVKHRSEFQTLDKPKSLLDYVREGAQIRVYQKLDEFEGLQEGEQVISWFVESIKPHSDEETLDRGWCAWHASVVKDGLIIADKILGHS